MTEKTNPEPWKIIVLPPVKKRLSKVPRKERTRILDAIYGLKTNPFSHDLRPMRGRPFWRLRVGDWRVLLEVETGKLTITAVAAGTRGNIYK